MRKADVLVFATPIYYYEMCEQMKTMLDRANPLYDSDYQFRDIYLLASAAETEESVIDGAMKGISGWIECFLKSKLAGTVFGGGADAVGAIQEWKKALILGAYCRKTMNRCTHRQAILFCIREKPW